MALVLRLHHLDGRLRLLDLTELALDALAPLPHGRIDDGRERAAHEEEKDDEAERVREQLVQMNELIHLLNLSLEEEHRDERVDRERLDEAEADDHGDLDPREGFRLAAHRLHCALSHEAESDARPDRGQTDP